MIGPFVNEYRWLSNFWPVKIVTDMEYPSVEHAYQAAKSSDLGTRQYIARLPTPGKAKRAGSVLSLPPDWEERKVDVMRRMLRRKFAHPELRQKLLATGDEALVEVNVWGDTFWGVCKGKGDNHLGQLLMEIRAEIRAKGG